MAVLSLGLEPLPTHGVRPSAAAQEDQDPLRGGSVVPGGHAGYLRIEPHTQISGHFLLWDSQLRGLVMHDKLSNVEMATAILTLRTVSRTRFCPWSSTAAAPTL